MQKIIIKACVLTLTLISFSGCTFFPGVHKIDIQQGNLINQEMVDKLKPGMTRSQVRYVMGTPIIADTFEQDRWDYFYSLKPGGGETEYKRLTLYFVDDKLSHLSGDLRPGAEPVEESATTAE